MLIVRFPSGVSVVYNNATQLYREEHWWQLYTAAKEKDGKWVCSIQASAGVIIEAVQACRVDAPPIVHGEQALRAVVDAVQAHQLDDAPDWLLRDLKRELHRYNARTRTWRA